MYRLISTVSAVSMLLATATASAALYTNPGEELPFDISLDSGSTGWVNPTANLRSQHAPYSWTGETVTSTTYGTEQIQASDPELWMNYVDRTIETYYYEALDQSAQVQFNASLTPELSAPRTYTISGRISSDGTPLARDGSISIFDMAMRISMQDPAAVGSLDSSMLFQVQSATGSWTYSSQHALDATRGTVRLSDYLFGGGFDPADYNDFTFVATFDFSAVTVPFTLDGIYVNVLANVFSNPSEALVDTRVEREVIRIYTPAPPSPPNVPVPGAAWLLGSGLAGILTAAQRRA